MNLGQCIDAEAVQEGRLSAPSRLPRPEEKTAEIHRKRSRHGERASAIVAAQRGKRLTSTALFQEIGDANRAAFDVQLSTMYLSGQLARTGDKKPFLYHLPDEAAA